MEHHRGSGASVRQGADRESLPPHIRDFLDGLAEMIADLIIEDDQGTGASSIEPATTTRQGAEEP
jgi:hypothetical protein